MSDFTAYYIIIVTLYALGWVVTWFLWQETVDTNISETDQRSLTWLWPLLGVMVLVAQTYILYGRFMERRIK
jgi:hypothetical protein